MRDKTYLYADLSLYVENKKLTAQQAQFREGNFQVLQCISNSCLDIELAAVAPTVTLICSYQVEADEVFPKRYSASRVG